MPEAQGNKQRLPGARAGDPTLLPPTQPTFPAFISTDTSFTVSTANPGVNPTYLGAPLTYTMGVSRTGLWRVTIDVSVNSPGNATAKQLGIYGTPGSNASFLTLDGGSSPAGGGIFPTTVLSSSNIGSSGPTTCRIVYIATYPSKALGSWGIVLANSLNNVPFSILMSLTGYPV